MVTGAVSIVGSSSIDPNYPPLCLNFLTSCGDSSSMMGRRRTSVVSHSGLSFSSSFIDSYSLKSLCGFQKSKKPKKNKATTLVVVDELAGQYEDSFEDVKRQIVDYFTYKAVRTVLNQLYEMDPTQYRWFYDYVAANEHGYGKHFIRNLVKERQSLGERVMVTRLHLYGKWIKKCDHSEMYDRISDQNLELMRERLMETVIWPPSTDSNIG